MIVARIQATSHCPSGGMILRKGRISQLVLRTQNWAKGCRKGNLPHCNKTRAQHMMDRALANKNNVLLITQYLKEPVVFAFLLPAPRWQPHHQSLPESAAADQRLR